MPKFLYTIIFLSLLSWGIVFYIVGVVNPSSYLPIFMFIFCLFIALSFTLSLLFFSILKKKKPDFLKDNVLYKKSFKYAAYISFGISGVALLRAFKIINLLNLGLFMLLYIGIFYQLKGKR